MTDLIFNGPELEEEDLTLELSRDLDRIGLSQKKLQMIGAAIFSELARIINHPDFWKYNYTGRGRTLDLYETKRAFVEILLNKSENLLMKALVDEKNKKTD